MPLTYRLRVPGPPRRLWWRGVMHYRTALRHSHPTVTLRCTMVLGVYCCGRTSGVSLVGRPRLVAAERMALMQIVGMMKARQASRRVRGVGRCWSTLVWSELRCSRRVQLRCLPITKARRRSGLAARLPPNLKPMRMRRRRWWSGGVRWALS